MLFGTAVADAVDAPDEPVLSSSFVTFDNASTHGKWQKHGDLIGK
ncbi:hypothetical protein [Stenoxybacter acetivorans]|nr:hypothetical protein [Stenoxybacter acetivorans]